MDLDRAAKVAGVSRATYYRIEAGGVTQGALAVLRVLSETSGEGFPTFPAPGISRKFDGLHQFVLRLTNDGARLDYWLKSGGMDKVIAAGWRLAHRLPFYDGEVFVFETSDPDLMPFSDEWPHDQITKDAHE
jgi:hypothetical protein